MRQKRVTGDKQIQRASRKEPMTEGIQKKRKKQRNWVSMSDKELVSYAKTYIEENVIKSRSGLAKADQGLYQVLRVRNLLNAVIPDKVYRNWTSITDKELISYAKTFIEENKIKNRKGLRKADSGLYQILTKRNLLVVVIPEKQCRDWASMGDNELISFARVFVEKNKIKNRKDLEKSDGGLSFVLRKRNLWNAVIPEKQHRDWSSMSDEELISFAKNFKDGNGIKSRRDLQKTDVGVYLVLSKRNLLAAVIPEKQRRDWSSMTDKELISYAKTYIEENKIKNRYGLQKADSNLYKALRKRNLLSAVFSDIEQAKKTAAVKQVVDAMKEFGEKE